MESHRLPAAARSRSSDPARSSCCSPHSRAWATPRGFIHASRVWQNGRFVWIEAPKCIAGFQFGMLMYWVALWKLTEYGVVAAEVQTLFWFSATIIGVALLSGRNLQWPPSDQLVAAGVLAGIAWLIYRGAR